MRGRMGCAARPLEKPERAWRGRFRAVLPRFLGLLNWSSCPPGQEAWGRFHQEPQTLQSRPSGSAPSGRVLRRGSGRHPARPGRAGLVACARSSGRRGARRVMCPRKVWVSCRSKVFTYSRTFLMAALGGNPPAAKPRRRAGGSPNFLQQRRSVRAGRGRRGGDSASRRPESPGRQPARNRRPGLPPPGRFYLPNFQNFLPASFPK